MGTLLRTLLLGIVIGLLTGVAYAPTTQEETLSPSAAVLEIPIYEGGEIQWELYLSNRDFLGWAKEALQELAEEERFPLQLPNELLRMWFLLKPLAEALAGLEEVRLLNYIVKDVDISTIMDFYDLQFPLARGWQRNFWMRPSEDSQGGLVYSFSEQGRLRQVAFFYINKAYREEKLWVIAARTQGFLDLKALVEFLVLSGQLMRNR